MRKKIFSALMLGLIMAGTASTVTSCKDYDEDIAALNKQNEDLAATLAKVQADLESEVSSLKTQLEAAKGKITVLETESAKHATKVELAATQADLDNAKKELEATKKELTSTQAAVAALETRLATAESALVDLKKLVDTKVDQSVYDAMVADVYAKLSSVDTKLAEQLQSIKNLEKGLADEKLAREAVAKDLAEQVKALEAFKKASEEADKKLQGQIDDLVKKDTELQKKIDDLVKDLNALADRVKKNEGDIATLKSDLEKLVKRVSEVEANIVTLNVLVETALRSLVFTPDFYYQGIEATELETMNYVKYTLKDVDADKDGEFNLTTETGVKVPESPSTDANHWRYKSTEAFKVLNFSATYHLNPSTANLDGAKYALLSADKDYRAAAAGLEIKSTEKKGGDLVVTLGVKTPSAVKDIAHDKMVTVFATEVTVPVADKAQAAAGKTLTVTSDYAAVKAVAKKGGYVLSNVVKASATADATAAERKTMTGVLNENKCGNCSTVTPHAGLHLFRTFEEAAYPNGKNVQPTVDAQAVVAWDSELDLLTLVETHEVEGDKPVKVQTLKDNNLEYVFEMVGSFYGGNKTSEGAHAALKDGHILHPQMPTTDGKQAKLGATAQDKATIGRQPVIRVSLKDTKNNEILDYGYIRVRIASTPEVMPADKFISYTGKDWSYTINHGCVETEYTAYDWSNNWIQVEYDLYSELKVSKEVFDTHYKAEDTGLYAGLDQYKLNTTTNKFEKQTVALGEFAEVINTGTSETTTLTWKISKATMKANFNKPGTYTAERAVKYVSDDKSVYPDVYVYVKSGKITVTDGGKASATMNLDPQKIKEYWYAHNLTTEGKAEARVNVPSPEDGKTTVADPFETVVSSQFVGNKIDADAIITVTDPTADKAFAKSKLTYTLVFDAANEAVGAKFKGQSGQEYRLFVGTEGKVLYAYIDANKNNKHDATEAEQVVAKLEIADPLLPAGINNTKLAYQHTDYAEDLLNYCTHKPLVDDFLTAVIGIQVKNACGMVLPVTNNTFNERFIRPIDVTNKDTKVQDAAKELQVIKLKDLVELNDWRDVKFADGGIDYWTYYNIKSITVRGAAAGTNINSRITTDMNGNDLNTKKLSEVTDAVEFIYAPVAPGTPSATADYGTITYKNNSNNVRTFKVKIPVRVTYQWGYVDTYATVTVDGTKGQSIRR